MAQFIYPPAAGGGATEATLQAINAKLPATLGQKTMANSFAVVIASDQSPVAVTSTPNVTDFGASTTAQRVAALLGNATGAAAFNTGASSAQTLRVIPASDTSFSQLPTTIGQKAMAASVSVTMASDQGLISVAIPGIGTDFGATNVSLRTAAQIGNTTGAAAFNTGASSAQTLRVIPASDTSFSQLPTTLGQKTMAASTGVVIASDQSAIPTSLSGSALNYGAATAALRVAAQIGNATAVADFGSGTTSAQTIRVVTATDAVVNAKPRFTRVQAPVLIDAVNIAASGGTRYLAATAAAEITRLFLRDATGLFINWYSAITGGTLLFQTGPGVEVPLDIVITNGTTLYIESATSTAGSSGALLSVNFLS